MVNGASVAPGSVSQGATPMSAGSTVSDAPSAGGPAEGSATAAKLAGYTAVLKREIGPSEVASRIIVASGEPESRRVVGFGSARGVGLM